MLCCCLVVKLCPTLRDPMDQSTPGSLVFHCLPEFGQIRVGNFDDTVQSCLVQYGLGEEGPDDIPQLCSLAHTFPRHYRGAKITRNGDLNHFFL